MALKDRFVRELRRQFRLDLSAMKPGGGGKEHNEACRNQPAAQTALAGRYLQSLENGENVSTEELFIGEGEKRRKAIS